MNLNYKQEVTVGLLVLVGLGLFLGGTFWLKGESLSRGQREVLISFPDVGTLKKGAAVRVSGVSLGKVEAIKFRSAGDVLVTARVSPQVEPKIDATARLATVGLVEDAVIVFHPGTSTERLPPTRVIQGEVAEGLTTMVQGIGDEAKQTLARVKAIEYEQLAQSFDEALAAMRRLMMFYGDTVSGPVANLNQTVLALNRLIERLDTTMARSSLESTIRRSDSLLQSLTQSSASLTQTSGRLDSILQKINRGEGTLGLLVNDTVLYHGISRAATALEGLLVELRKHPGKVNVNFRLW